MRRSSQPRPDAGFSLLELVVVMGVISILAGIGIGFVSGADDGLNVARGQLRAKLRLCYETARNEGRPTELFVIPRDDAPDLISAKILDLAGQWHFEENERAFAGLDPVIRGKHEPAGRFGACLRHDEGQTGDMFSLETKGIARLNVDEGFSLRMEVFLESRRKATLCAWDRTLTLSLDEELRPVAELVLRDPSGAGPGARLNLAPKQPALALNRWISLELSYDRRQLQLLVDGEIVAEVKGRGWVYQPPSGQQLRISLEKTPVPGKVDEVQLLVYQLDEPEQLPVGIEVDGLQGGVAFDRLGRLRRPVTLVLKNGPETEQREVAPGGVLR